MRAVLLILAACCCVLICFVGWYKWDSSQNRGSSFGYYGQYNRVSNALASIPGVTITAGWHNQDVTLEEFGFDLSITGKPVRLVFGEIDPVRGMKREAAISGLQRRIQEELAASTQK